MRRDLTHDGYPRSSRKHAHGWYYIGSDGLWIRTMHSEGLAVISWRQIEAAMKYRKAARPKAKRKTTDRKAKK